jgi:hypothetical protein
MGGILDQKVHVDTIVECLLDHFDVPVGLQVVPNQTTVESRVILLPYRGKMINNLGKINLVQVTLIVEEDYRRFHPTPSPGEDRRELYGDICFTVFIELHREDEI